jgi:hypothetical protein
VVALQLFPQKFPGIRPQGFPGVGPHEKIASPVKRHSAAVIAKGLYLGLVSIHEYIKGVGILQKSRVIERRSPNDCSVARISQHIATLATGVYFVDVPRQHTRRGCVCGGVSALWIRHLFTLFLKFLIFFLIVALLVINKKFFYYFFLKKQMGRQLLHIFEENRVYDVPTNGQKIVRFIIPQDCDLVRHINCSQTGSQLVLIGAGCDIIPTKNLEIIMMNALYTPMVIKIMLSEHVPVPESVQLLYEAILYVGNEAKRPNFNGNLARYNIFSDKIQTA